MVPNFLDHDFVNDHNGTKKGLTIIARYAIYTPSTMEEAMKVTFSRTEAWRTQGHKTSNTAVFVDGKQVGEIYATEPIAYGGMAHYNIKVGDYHSWAATLNEAKEIVRRHYAHMKVYGVGTVHNMNIQGSKAS
jgi:ribosomal protein S16